MNKQFNILAFDTASNVMHVILAQNNNILISKTVETTKERYNSALLIPTIIGLLKNQGLNMQDIDIIGVNTGPGSFTGIRASATVAKVTAQSLDIPVIGISSLQIMATLNNTEKLCLSTLDAKRNKAYVGVYDNQADEVQEPCLESYEDVINKAESKDFYVITDSAMSKKFQESDIEAFDVLKSETDMGKSLVRLINKKLNKTKELEHYKWYNLKPLYLQSPPITMKCTK